MAAGRVVKEEGKQNDLIERIVSDPAFNLTDDEIQKILKPENFIGRASYQVSEFIDEYVNPVLDDNEMSSEVELTV